MSQENVEIVRGLWEAWERGDLTGVLDTMSDDVETRRHTVIDSSDATFRGKGGVP